MEPSPAPEPLDAEPYKELNPFGDVRVRVKAKSGTRDFRVVSYQLMVASPFFANLLSPDSTFAEAVAFRAHRKLEPYVLEINLEDLPTRRALQSCETVLRHCHAMPAFVRSDGKEGIAELDELYDLSITVDYFDCRAVGEALSKYAMPSFVDELGEYNGALGDVDKWLFISTLLRRKEVFKAITRFCIKNGQLKDDGLRVNSLGGKKDQEVVKGPKLVLISMRVIGMFRWIHKLGFEMNY